MTRPATRSPDACPDLTPAEFGALKALWALGQGSVSEVRAHLASVGTEVAYTTVMTLLTRLAAKGAVEVDRAREPFVYRAAQRRESVLGARLRAFVRDVFDGDAAALASRLVEDASLTPAQAADLERRIADAAPPPARRPRPRKRST